MVDVTFTVGGERVAGTFTPATGSPRGTLLMVHGMQSRRLEFGAAPEALGKRGYHVLAIDLRGHGDSAGARGIVSRARAVEDVRGALAWLRENGHARGGRLGIIGHSLGGALSAACLADIPDLRCGVLVAPVNRLTDELHPFEFLGYKMAGRLSAVAHRFTGAHLSVPYKLTYKHLFDDKEAMRRAKAQGFLDTKLTLGNYDNFLAVCGSEWASQVAQPTLVVVCKNDRALKPASQRKVYEALKGPKDLLELDSGHSAFTDRNHALLLDAIDGWMEKTLGAIPQV